MKSVRFYNEYVQQQHEQIISYARETAEPARAAAAGSKDALIGMRKIVEKGFRNI